MSVTTKYNNKKTISRCCELVALEHFTPSKEGCFEEIERVRGANTLFHNYFVVELRFIPRSGNTIPLSPWPRKAPEVSESTLPLDGWGNRDPSQGTEGWGGEGFGQTQCLLDRCL